MRIKRKDRLKKTKLKKRIVVGGVILTLSAILTIIYIGFRSVKLENKESNVKVVVEKKKEIVIPKYVLESKDKNVQALVKESKDNEDAKIILSNLKAYPNRLVELAGEKPETIKFVCDYKENKDKAPSKIDVKKDYVKGEIPHFLQWDERWGYEKYGDQFIAVNGCGPTSIAMIAVGLTGNTDINPKVVADYAYKNGYLVEDIGSKWTLMTKGAREFGITGREIPKAKDSIKKELESGHPIIATMSKGHFTTGGHYLVISGIDKDGKLEVKDSDSIIRTNKTWDMDTILKEGKNFWSYKKSN